MRLSFKPNVTCKHTRNLWFVNVLSTFRRQNSVVKNWQLVGGPPGGGVQPMVQSAQWLIGHWPMTFIYELELYCLEIYRMCKYELPTSRLSEVIV